jgi:hypothetical protein
MLLISCQKETTEWDNFVTNFIQEYFDMFPTTAVWEGLHEYDGEFPDLTEAGIQKTGDWLQTSSAIAERFEPADLSKAQRFEREYLLVQIDKQIFWLITMQQPFTNPGYYTGIVNPSVYITREYAPLQERLESYIKFAAGIPSIVSQIKSNLRTPLPGAYIKIGSIQYGGLASFYENDIPEVFAAVDDQELQDNFSAVNSAAVAALKDLDDWLIAQEAEATDDFALGPELFQEMLWATERVSLSLDELEAIGRKDLERNLLALKKACTDLAPDKSITETIALVMSDKPENGPVDEARSQLAALKTFIVDQQLVTIPGEEEALVDTTPPYMRWNFAFINIPGAYEKNLPSTYYISPPDPSWSVEDQQSYIPGKNRLMFTSVHEVWPGHFLHSLHAKRVDSRLGRIFGSYAFSEGWAHYTEELMWEAGLGNQDPAMHIGQLIPALLRNVRYLSAIGLHTQGMTVEESEKMFLELAYTDPGTARQQASRGTFDPGYLNYTLGKLMILKLREDWMEKKGEGSSLQEFHDEFLSRGTPPIALIRDNMLGENSGPVL